MACRGIFYAITDDEQKHLLSLVGDDAAVSDAVHMLYSTERDAAGLQVSVDKAWDAMHRCLGNGLLDDVGTGDTALSRLVLGGWNLYEGGSYIICLVEAKQVVETAAAANRITKDWMRDRYFRLDPRRYEGPWGEQDWEYTWSYFEATREFYNNAAQAGRAVVFLTDQ